MNGKRLMSLSLDLDNKWSYLRTFGNAEWVRYPSYLELVCPRILQFFAARNVKITFFIVGRDATLNNNRSAIASLSAAGHEIGNHSFEHEPWLHLYTDQHLERDIALAEDAIEDATGVKPKGFRGPGYSLTGNVLSVLRRRGYRYDATAFPNILNPLARAYLFAATNLSKEEQKKRKALFGSFSDALRPVKPYRWQLENDLFLELPVTTMPIFKIPIHFSYLTYLGMYSRNLAMVYLNMTILMCKLTSTEPSLLLHPLDFIGMEDDSDLSIFPGMRMPLTRKLELMGAFVDKLMDHFEPVTMGQHIEKIDTKEVLKQYRPTFAAQIA